MSDGLSRYDRAKNDYFFNWLLYDGEGSVIGIRWDAPDKTKEAYKKYANEHSMPVKIIDSGWLSEEPSSAGEYILMGLLCAAIIRGVSQYLWWI
ncbi:hypothetical protein [Methanomicrobium mobile]|uniref:hypothetical protein n=1 Tax=Methanomicrobium mobile TaxID=2205 RepID=UPI0005B25268|nr:hypothetical protein [Methanomicrobium mobile]